LLWLKGQWLNW